MARREDVENSIWSDSDFLSLAGPARLVYVWSFTNPRCNMAGIYQVPRQAILMETGVQRANLDRVLQQLEAGRFLFYDDRVMFVRSRVKYLRSRSNTIARAIGNDLTRLGKHPFVYKWWEENAHHQWITRELDGSYMGYGGPLEGSTGKGKGKGKLETEAFEYWKERCRKPKAKFTDQRVEHVHARLQHYSLEDVKRGIDGAAKNPPRNRETGVVYDDLVSVCRNDDQLERYMERANAKVMPIRSQAAQKSDDYLNDYPPDGAA